MDCIGLNYAVHKGTALPINWSLLIQKPLRAWYSTKTLFYFSSTLVVEKPRNTLTLLPYYHPLTCKLGNKVKAWGKHFLLR